MNTFLNLQHEFPVPDQDRKLHISMWITYVPLMTRIAMRGQKEQYSARLLNHMGIPAHLAQKRYNKRKNYDFSY